jgi:hypothetical protein
MGPTQSSQLTYAHQKKIISKTKAFMFVVRLEQLDPSLTLQQSTRKSKQNGISNLFLKLKENCEKCPQSLFARS